VAAVELIYSLLREIPGTWWLVAGSGFTAFFVVLSALAPVLLFRIFFKFEPLHDGDRKDRLLALSERLGVYVCGRARRILLADTLIDEHSPDEIEVVLAHEMALGQPRYLKGLAPRTPLVFAAL
jgi:STE24 endopeptidase